MFKFLKKLFTCICLVVVIIVGMFCYNTYKNFKNYNNLIKNLNTVSLTNSSSPKSSSSNSYLNHPSLNPATIVEDDTSSTESNSLENIANNYTVEVKNIDISQEIENIAEINDILSNKSNFDVAIKLNDTSTLVSLDNNLNKISVFNFGVSNFDTLKEITDKYININISDFNSIDSLKNEFMNTNLFGKYDLFSKVLKNSDTNLSESDILSLYFSSLSK